MQAESTVEEILNTVQRFRILCVGRAGVGKSSLVNHVFGIQEATVSHFKRGESDINKEYTSTENQFFVLHDSKGFEPGRTANFEIARQFIAERCDDKLPLKDRLHAVWLCTESPTAGGRLFEIGDEKLLQFAHERQVPMVVVFTQYDKLVRTKKSQLKEENDTMDPEALDQLSKAEAKKAFQACVRSMAKTMERLNIPLPDHANVSIRKGYKDLEFLIEVTRNIVQERIKGDAWRMWAIAQRVSLPMKVEASISTAMGYYRRTLAAGMPGVGKILLHDCLVQVHQDIVTCWNFKDAGKILKSEELRQLMLFLIQDIQNESSSTTPPDIDRISQFVTLITAASAPIAPPAAILGLTYFFVKWLSDATLDNVPLVQRLLMAYTVDLISVLKSLFDFTLKPSLSGSTDWEVLREAFEAYESSNSLQIIHDAIRLSFGQSRPVINSEGFQKMARELLQ